uniref:EMI domain-containing protein n=1 Tax=Cyclopterus lumpus TaxID=8103 RepID=A0A8C3AK26_CYCLU
TAVLFCTNWCPHTVTKTVTCQVHNGTVLQRVYQTCRWPQGCTGGSYRTVVRPSYKVVYRTVTSLEWKCCPGFSGAACEEGKWRQKDSQTHAHISYTAGNKCLQCLKWSLYLWAVFLFYATPPR